MTWLDHTVYLSTGPWMGRSHLLATVNNAAMDMAVQMSLQVPAFNSVHGLLSAFHAVVLSWSYYLIFS